MGKVIDLSGEGSGGGVSIGFTNVAQNYTALALIVGVTGQLSYVVNSEGTAWLPSGMGGTYYPNGIYIFDGANWISDRNAISQQLQINIDDIDALETSVAGKLDSVVGGANITVDNTDPNNPIINGVGAAGRNNYVLVKKISDFPTPSGGVITLADNTAYEINGTISFGTDRIVCGVSNVIYGIDKSDDILFYTGTGDLITVLNNDFSINKVTVSAVSGCGLKLTGDGTNRVEIAENIFGNCKIISEFTGGFEDLIFRNNLIVGSEQGINIAGTYNDIYVIDNIIKDAKEAFNPTYINMQSGTVGTFFIRGNHCEVDTDEIFIDILESGVTRLNILIQENVVNGLGNGLKGINANDTNVTIPYRSNIGIVGLFKQQVNWGADGAFGTTSTVNLSPIFTTGTYASYDSGGVDIIKLTLRGAVTHEQSGKSVQIEINDVTNGNVAVVGSAVIELVPVAGVYHIVTTPEVELNPDTEYNIKVTDVDGSGQNLAGARSGVWNLIAYKQ